LMKIVAERMKMSGSRQTADSRALSPRVNWL